MQSTAENAKYIEEQIHAMLSRARVNAKASFKTAVKLFRYI